MQYVPQSVPNLTRCLVANNQLCFVQVFFFSHIIGFVMFTVFGLLHWHGFIWTWITGLLVYGIDATYRWVQACHTVDVGISASKDGTIVSLIMPMEVRLLLNPSAA